MSRPTMVRPAMSAPHFGMRASQPPVSRPAYGSRALPGGRYVRNRSGAPVARPPLRQLSSVRGTRANPAVLSEDVPGLGFDYTHVAATHPRGDHGRDHDGERDAQFLGAYFPVYGGGYYMPPFDDQGLAEAPADGEQQAGAQQVDNVEPGPPQTAEIARPAEPSQDYVPPPQFLPPQDSDEYVFVRRDGTLFFATAFAWENGTLRYITREGLRHTLTLDKLDLNATQQFNEQRGLNFRLPV
ncbi:MAG: hypothetical protein ACYDCG_12770 [Candidatus Acidiferrales bacterium]